MYRITLIALCLVAGVAVSLGSPTVAKDPAEPSSASPPQPKITYSKETIAEEGEDVTIDCAVEGVDVTGVQGFSVSWSKIDEDKPTNSLPLTANDKVLLFTSAYSVSHPEDSQQYSLTIKNVNEDNIGLYRCTVNFGEEQKINADVIVTMRKSPFFTDDFTKTLTVDLGDAISIDCQPGGVPKPDVYWERLNDELPYYGGKFFKANQLDIPFIERNHEGHYVCYADNGYGEPANSHIILEVQFAPEVTVTKNQIFASSGDSAVMTCNVEAHPPADVAWYKDDIIILGDSNKKVSKVDIPEEGGRERLIGVETTLSISEVTADDFGSYSCKAVNTIGSTEVNAKLRLKSPPMIVTQSKKEVIYDLQKSNLRDALPVVIECMADGAPTPNYRWNKNGEMLVWQADPRLELEPDTGNLLITDPSLEDNGLYQCFAFNELGTAVADPVYLLNFTSIQFSNAGDNKDNYDVEAELGRPLKLSCPNATAYPTPKLSWVKAIQLEDKIELEFVNDERVVTDPNGNLWFTHVIPEDATSNFQYMCLGSTEFEPADYSIASIINLKVVPPADGEENHAEDSLNVESFRMYTSPEEVNFEANMENTLWCIYGGEPAPEVNWRRSDGVEINETRFVTRNFGRTLVFKETLLQDAGEYECLANNAVGETKSSKMMVTVTQMPTFVGEFASQTVKEGTTVTFTCEVEATGDIAFSWMFNGRPITADVSHPRRTISSSMLTIDDVTLVDIGNYACNATSELGYAYGQATLNVIPGENRVGSVSSGEIEQLRQEVKDLRKVVQNILDLTKENLQVTNQNSEKLNVVSIQTRASCNRDDSMPSQEVQKTADEEMMDEAEEEMTTEAFFNKE